MKFITCLVIGSFFAIPAFAQSNLYQFLEDAFNRKAEVRPLHVSMYGYRTYQGNIESHSIEGAQKYADFLEAEIQKLKNSFNYSDLNRNDQISFEAFVYQYESDIDFYRNFYVYGPIFNDWSYTHLRLMSALQHNYDFKVAGKIDEFFRRLEQAPQHYKELIALSENALNRGIFTPKVVLETALKTLERYTKGFPFDDSDTQHPLYKSFSEKLLESNFNTEQIAQYKERIRVQMQTSLKPALIEFYQHGLSLLPNAGENTGLHAVPGGLDYYDHLLQHFTTTDMKADAIHQLGLKEVSRIKNEMEVIKNKVGFQGSLREFFIYLREDAQFFYPNTDEGRQAYLDRAIAYIDEMNTYVDQLFLNPPTTQVKVKPVPAESATGGGGAYYSPSEHTYYVDLSNMANQSIVNMQTLAYHEASPGHHFHFTYVERIENLPTFRKFLFLSGHTEGWGLYSERLGAELGLFKDPIQDFGRLNYEMLRAVRLVVDTGMHAMGWSLEDAVAYGLDNTGFPEGSIRSQMTRYLSYPAQATSYKIGMNFILDERAKAQEAMGDNFDIREYHEVVLQDGFLPLAIVKRNIDAWVASKPLRLIQRQ